jgi:glyoxylate/hydroxypyruvate reductase
MGAILLAVTGLDPKPWEERFRALAPRRDIRVWPERVGEPGEVAYACAWHAPHGLLAHFLHLKIVFSLGAGVDHIVADPHLPDVPVLRMVDADLNIRMTEYVVLHVLMQHGPKGTFGCKRYILGLGVTGGVMAREATGAFGDLPPMSQ